MKKPRKKKIKQEEHPKGSNPNSTFFLTFVGENIEVVCKNVVTTTEIGVFPLIITGYLMDVDDEYLYLSDDGNTVSRAVKKDEHIVIEIRKEESEQDLLLESVVPTADPKDAN